MEDVEGFLVARDQIKSALEREAPGVFVEESVGEFSARVVEDVSVVEMVVKLEETDLGMPAVRMVALSPVVVEDREQGKGIEIASFVNKVNAANPPMALAFSDVGHLMAVSPMAAASECDGKFLVRSVYALSTVAAKGGYGAIEIAAAGADPDKVAYGVVGDIYAASFPKRPIDHMAKSLCAAAVRWRNRLRVKNNHGEGIDV